MIDRIRWHYRAWRYRYRVEPREIRWILEHIPSGATVIDVGAHKGAYTYWLRRRVGASGQVHAFEPQPGLARRLRRLADGAGLGNVHIVQKGLSSRPGTLSLAVPGGGNSPSASFETTEDSAGAELHLRVEVTTLDDYFDNEQASPVRFIKCDAEGHELEVFRGAERLLTRARPDLLFECEQRHLGRGSPLDVFGYLEGLGYRGQAFGPDGLMDVARFDLSVHQHQPGEVGYVNNFLFTAPGGARG